MNSSAEIFNRLSSRDSLGITGVYLPGQDRGDCGTATRVDAMLSPSQSSSGATGQVLPLPIQFGAGPDPSQEAKHLKGLFLANIDLVQHQQEILIAKDRTIQSLRLENESVRILVWLIGSSYLHFTLHFILPPFVLEYKPNSSIMFSFCAPIFLDGN